MKKALSFIKEVRGEMSRVVWPTKNDVVKYTLLVVVLSLVVAIIIGSVDLGLVRLLDYFIR